MRKGRSLVFSTSLKRYGVSASVQTERLIEIVRGRRVDEEGGGRGREGDA